MQLIGMKLLFYASGGVKEIDWALLVILEILLMHI